MGGTNGYSHITAPRNWVRLLILGNLKKRVFRVSYIIVCNYDDFCKSPLDSLSFILSVLIFRIVKRPSIYRHRHTFTIDLVVKWGKR
jgi:hypothetical protein